MQREGRAAGVLRRVGDILSRGCDVRHAAQPELSRKEYPRCSRRGYAGHPRAGHVADPADPYTGAPWLTQRKNIMTLAVSQLILTAVLLVGFSVESITSRRG